jgi:hypothetical protein
MDIQNEFKEREEREREEREREKGQNQFFVLLDKKVNEDEDEY